MVQRKKFDVILRFLVDSRHVAKGGSEGADEPPFFSDQKKKVDGVRVWQLRVPGAIAPASCMHRRIRRHGPEPNLENVAV